MKRYTVNLVVRITPELKKRLQKESKKKKTPIGELVRDRLERLVP